MDSVREVINRRLARLSQPCIRMLTLAALDGVKLRPWLLTTALRTTAVETAALDTRPMCPRSLRRQPPSGC